MEQWNEVPMSALESETLVSVIGLKKESPVVTFVCAGGREFRMRHEQDCCEDVSVHDIVGDVEDLLGAPILSATEAVQVATDGEREDESGTWTFYHLRTVKGSVTLTWLGTSNGYYNETVQLEERADRHG